MINAHALCKPDFEKFCVRVSGHILTTIRNTEINSWQFFFVMTGNVKPSLPQKSLFYEYELYYFDGDSWTSLGYRLADSNILHFDNIPLNTLLWLRNYTRGNNERPFIIKESGDIEWW